MRVGLDLDGVCYAWEKTARYMLRQVFPNSPYKDDPRLKVESLSWNYIQECVNEEAWNWLWTEGVRLGLFRYGHSYPGTIQAVRELATLGEVVVITHRPKQAVNDTLDWLSFQRLPVSGVHLLTDQEPKSSVKPGCDVYLDDKPENVIDLCENSGARMVGLMVRPWNEDYRGRKPPYAEKGLPWAERILSWSQFVEKVRTL